MTAYAFLLTDRLASTVNYVPLLGGLLNKAVSPGMTTLQAWMALQGIETAMHGATEAKSLVDTLHKLKAEDPSRKIIVVGYSLGGAAACDLCNWLAVPERKVEIDLLVTLVPPRRLLSWNVKRALNLTVKGGSWWSDFIYRGYGEKNTDGITNIDHFSVLGITHYSIQGLPSVHSAIHEAVREVIA